MWVFCCAVLQGRLPLARRHHTPSGERRKGLRFLGTAPVGNLGQFQLRVLLGDQASMIQDAWGDGRATDPRCQTPLWPVFEKDDRGSCELLYVLGRWALGYGFGGNTELCQRMGSDVGLRLCGGHVCTVCTSSFEQCRHLPLSRLCSSDSIPTRISIHVFLNYRLL